MSTSILRSAQEVNMKLTQCISRSNFMWSSWKFLNSQNISARTRGEQGLSQSEHEVSGSVPVLSRSLHKAPRRHVATFTISSEWRNPPKCGLNESIVI